MSPITYSILLSLFLCGDEPTRNSDGTTRKPHPLAPSLPETTKKDEDRFDKVIDRFIQADIGKLNAADTKAAMEEFRKLPPESVFALIRGFNTAAKIDHSCPSLVIGKRLAQQFRTTRDKELLIFARENIGAGVGPTPHADIIKDLRFGCSRRLTALANQ